MTVWERKDPMETVVWSNQDLYKTPDLVTDLKIARITWQGQNETRKSGKTYILETQRRRGRLKKRWMNDVRDDLKQGLGEWLEESGRTTRGTRPKAGLEKHGTRESQRIKELTIRNLRRPTSDWNEGKEGSVTVVVK